ncbi:MAG: glycosyltransferase [Planctomycetota bacterium]
MDEALRNGSEESPDRVREWLETLADGRAAAVCEGPSGSWQVLESLADQCGPSEAPASLSANPCPLLAPEWHSRELRRLLAAVRPPPERITYHAVWLLHLLFAEEARRSPLVSIVIPLYNGSGQIADAVESCLEQSWPDVEVIVVDDGSTDEPEGVLAPYADRIHLQRQQNGGVSSARNAGIRRAKGEFLHFLDADDLLDPTCVETKIQAFGAVADAELCVSSYRVEGHDDGSRAAPPMAGPESPAADLLVAATTRYPFHTSSVLIPRWVVLETGFFDEDLPLSEDFRYWFRLALRGTKAIGIDRPLGTVRVVTGSLSESADRSDQCWVRVAMRNLTDLLQRPSLWPHVGTTMSQLRGDIAWPLVDASEDPALIEARSALQSQIARLDELGRAEGISAFPLLKLLHKAVRQGILAFGSTGFFRELEDQLRRLAKAAASITARDVELWLTRSAGLPRGQNVRSARRAVLRWLHGRKLAGQEQRSWAELLRLALPCPQHGWEGRWRTGARLERLLGSRAALSIMRGLERVRPVEPPT